MRFVSFVTAAALALLSARRALFLVASLLPEPTPRDPGEEPGVALLVAANDEASTLPRLLKTIEQLDWPHERLHVMLADDCSADRTWELMQRWAETHENARAVRLGQRSGKAHALNAALAAAPPGEVVAVCDADIRLASDYLRRLLPAFGDPEVGAAAGFVTSANSGGGLVARYSCLETWVHQLVTAAGKDRLGLNPATFAGSAYRREALEGIGGFMGSSAGDDVWASALLTEAGWRTRFVRAARADHVQAERVSDYLPRRLRWARNVFEAGQVSRIEGWRADRTRRVELALASVGYGDRIAFAAALGFAARRRMPSAVPAAYACIRALETVVAVVKAGEGRRLHSYLGAAAVVLPLDVVASLASVVGLRSGRSAAWRRARRSALSPFE